MCIFYVSLNVVPVISCDAAGRTLTLLDSEGKYCGLKIEKHLQEQSLFLGCAAVQLGLNVLALI